MDYGETERIQTCIQCLFEAGRRNSIYSIVPRAYGKYLTLKFQRKAAQQGQQQAKRKIKTTEHVIEERILSGTNFPDGI